MIYLTCPKCKSRLPSPQDGSTIPAPICPHCHHSMGSSAGKHVSDDATLPLDNSQPHIQEKLKEATSRRAQEASPSPVAKMKRPQQKEPSPQRSGNLPWIGLGVAGILAIGLLAYALTRDNKPKKPKPKPEPETSITDNQPPTIAALVQSLNDEAIPTRKQALQALRERGPHARPALAALLSQLKDSDPELRGLAQEALTAIGPVSDEDVPTYSAALRDPSPEVLVYTAGRLAELGQQARNERDYLRILSLDENAQVQAAARKAVAKINEAMLTDLTRNLKDPSAATRSKAARDIADMGEQAKIALPNLVEALSDDNSAVRLVVVDAFVAIGPDAIMVLGESLRDKNPNVRMAAVHALGKVGPDARFVLPELIAVASGAEGEIKEQAIQSLARIGEYAIPYLVQALEREKNPARQKPLVEALERLDPSAATALQAALKAAKPEVAKLTSTVLVKAESQPLPKPKKDHTGVAGTIQAQLRGWFTAADTDKDGFLDKTELARTIRGVNAKPYDFTSDGKPARTFGPRDFTQYPDYAFLCRLDRDNDAKISRLEYELWAYDHAVYLKEERDEKERIAQAQRRLAERNLTNAMKAQREAAVAQQWANYHNWNRTQNALNREVSQMKWLQRYTLNHLPKK